jgi:hypothetical protein
MFKNYERIYEENKAAGTAYAVGYKKIALATWLLIIGLVVVWFRTLIGLGIIFIGLCFWAWGTIQKKSYMKHWERKGGEKSV